MSLSIALKTITTTGLLLFFLFLLFLLFLFPLLVFLFLLLCKKV